MPSSVVSLMRIMTPLVSDFGASCIVSIESTRICGSSRFRSTLPRTNTIASDSMLLWYVA